MPWIRLNGRGLVGVREFQDVNEVVDVVDAPVPPEDEATEAPASVLRPGVFDGFPWFFIDFSWISIVFWMFLRHLG